MEKATVTKIVVEFSEKGALAGREFASVAELDTYLVNLYAQDELRAHDAYDKTDLTIHFTDGTCYNLRLDARRGVTLSGHLVDLLCYYSGHKPEYMTLQEWNGRKLAHNSFFRAHKL